MLFSRRLLAAVSSAGLFAVLGGCGAGLITGIAASGDGGNPPEATLPELSVSPVLPLVPPPGSLRSVVVTNAQLAGAAALEVRIEALGVVAVQASPSASGQGGSTLITFGVDTAAIAVAAGDPTVADVPARLSVWADGRSVADPASIVLARQPTASLLLADGQQQRFLSPGGERVQIAVAGLRSASPEDVQVLVTTPDPDGIGVGGGLPTVTRLATEIAFDSSSGANTVVSAFVPGSTFPVAAEIVVRDFVAGQSTAIGNAYYRPDIALALPSQGPTTGGSLLTLIGTALVPHDFTAGPGPAPLDFGAVQLSLSKGGRVSRLAPEDFRIAESDSDRLVFTMPPSPDGRPGQVDIVLQVELGTVTATVTASQVFLFANPDPFYGPRGAVLDRLPVAVVPIALDNAPSTAEAPDFAVLQSQGGVGFLQLLLAQQNGMFQPFAAPRQIGNPEVASERSPRDLCVGDFDGDLIPDLFLVNEGAATAVHHLVLGQARPLSPLGAVHQIVAPPGSWRGRVAFFDADALPDILLVPGPNAPAGQRPHVLLARPFGPGQPSFALPISVPVREFAYEAFEVADIDGDGQLDIAVVSGTELKLDVAFGLGDGTFATVQQLDFTVPGYQADPASPAVGLHACRDGVHQSLGLVLAGLLVPAPNPTPPVIVVLSQAEQAPVGSGVFQFTSPDLSAVFEAPTEPIGRSLAADIDDQPPIELVVGIRGDPQLISIGLLQLGATAFVPVAGGIENGVLGGGEAPLQIQSLTFDTAFPATALSGEAKAVFIVHEVIVDGVRERRLSTRLVTESATQQPVLLPPDAGGTLGFPIENIIGGNFHEISVAGEGAVLDLALVRAATPGTDDEIVLVQNDGFGGFPSLSSQLAFPGLLPDSLTLVPSTFGTVDDLVFLGRDSRLGFWRHDPAGPAEQSLTSAAGELRAALTGPLSMTDLDDDSRMQIADVDGDGIHDLVALLSFDVAAAGPGDACIALLRGKVSPQPGEFPFWLPETLTPVHGNASSFALGDFATGGGAPDRLELALTVPIGSGAAALDGNHVRFFHYVPGIDPGRDRFEPSSRPGGPQVLLAGIEPEIVVATDLDRDGLVDLLVACRGDSSLRLFRNTAAPAGPGGQVDVGAFVEGLASPNALAHGQPTVLQLRDVNGDGNLDAVVFVEDLPVSGQRSTSVAIYLSSGTGEFDGPRFVSSTRIGNRDARLSGDLGDWNRDGVPDLFLGWNTSINVNLRVLFGGTR